MESNLFSDFFRRTLFSKSGLPLPHVGLHVYAFCSMIRFRLVLPLAIILILCGEPAVLGQQAPSPTGEIDLGIISRKSGSDVISVHVASPDARLQGLMRKAFSVHGGYLLQTPEGADFTFRFTPTSDTSVRLDIESGQPPKVLFPSDVEGASLTEATLRAGDLAVQKTLGIPGFFAGRLAFVGVRSGSNEIYTSDLFFTSVRNLSSNRADCLGPAWMPDGRGLFYTSYYRNGFPDIFRVDAASGRHTLFAGFKGTNTGATVRPGGREVAMVLSGSGNSELYLGSIAGGGLRRLTRSTDSAEADPAWSPDGRNIIFTSDRLGRPQLFKLSISEGESRRVPTNISNFNAEPAWNPRNADLVAFTIRQGSYFKLALFDFSTKESRVLTSWPGDALEPEWTNDGRHLIYTSGMASPRKLMLLDTKTGKRTQLHADSLGDAFEADFLYIPR